jgi:hypothetical protein
MFAEEGFSFFKLKLIKVYKEKKNLTTFSFIDQHGKSNITLFALLNVGLYR